MDNSQVHVVEKLQERPRKYLKRKNNGVGFSLSDIKIYSN